MHVTDQSRNQSTHSSHTRPVNERQRLRPNELQPVQPPPLPRPPPPPPPADGTYGLKLVRRPPGPPPRLQPRPPDVPPKLMPRPPDTPPAKHLLQPPPLPKQRPQVPAKLHGSVARQLGSPSASSSSQVHIHTMHCQIARRFVFKYLQSPITCLDRRTDDQPRILLCYLNHSNLVCRSMHNINVHLALDCRRLALDS